MRIMPSSLVIFQQEDSNSETAVVSVLTKSKLALGTIRWHVPFRSYVFVPAEGRLYAYRVLADITGQIIAMMDDWAKASGRKPTHGKSSPYRPRARRCMAQSLSGTTCGRWLGHSEQHRGLGSNETWDA